VVANQKIFFRPEAVQEIVANPFISVSYC